jgi:hypothetical protein
VQAVPLSVQLRLAQQARLAVPHLRQLPPPHTVPVSRQVLPAQHASPAAPHAVGTSPVAPSSPAPTSDIGPSLVVIGASDGTPASPLVPPTAPPVPAEPPIPAAPPVPTAPPEPPVLPPEPPEPPVLPPEPPNPPNPPEPPLPVEASFSPGFLAPLPPQPAVSTNATMPQRTSDRINTSRFIWSFLLCRQTKRARPLHTVVESLRNEARLAASVSMGAAVSSASRTGADARAHGAGRAVLRRHAVTLDLAGRGSAAHDCAIRCPGTFRRAPTLGAIDVARALALTGERRAGVETDLAGAAARAGHLTVCTGRERAIAGAGAARRTVRRAGPRAGRAPITGARTAASTGEVTLVLFCTGIGDVVRQLGARSGCSIGDPTAAHGPHRRAKCTGATALTAARAFGTRTSTGAGGKPRLVHVPAPCDHPDGKPQEDPHQDIERA